jgi:hypothetical protein
VNHARTFYTFLDRVPVRVQAVLDVFPNQRGGIESVWNTKVVEHAQPVHFRSGRYLGCGNVPAENTSNDLTAHDRPPDYVSTTGISVVMKRDTARRTIHEAIDLRSH